VKPNTLEPRFLAAAKYAYEFVTSEKDRNGRAESYNRETVEHIASHLQKALAPQPAAPLVPLGENVTRDGRKARVLCNDLAGHGKRVIAAVESRNQTGEVTSFHYEDGRVNLDGTPESGDLVGHLPPEPVKPREFWINGYECRPGAIHHDKEAADRMAGQDRTECIHVREVLPGEADELESLREWKRQARSSTPDWQAIGKEMGLTLGQDVPSRVLSHIQGLKAQLSRSAQQ
jgi:hypothetical protein